MVWLIAWQNLDISTASRPIANSRRNDPSESSMRTPGVLIMGTRRESIGAAVVEFTSYNGDGEGKHHRPAPPRFQPTPAAPQTSSFTLTHSHTHSLSLRCRSPEACVAKILKTVMAATTTNPFGGRSHISVDGLGEHEPPGLVTHTPHPLITSVFDKGILRDTILPSVTLQSGRAHINIGGRKRK